MWCSPENFLFSADIWATLTTWLRASYLLYSAPSNLVLSWWVSASVWFCSLMVLDFLTWSTLERCSWILASFSFLACSLFYSAMLKWVSRTVPFSRVAWSSVDFLWKTLFLFSSEFYRKLRETFLFCSAFSSLALICSRERRGA